MRWLILAALVVFGLGHIESSALAKPRGKRAPTPFEMVRSLTLMQNQIIYGDKNAYRIQKPMIVEIERRLLAQKPEVWEDRRNVRAVIRFTMSGGGPKVLSKLVKNPILTELEKNWAMGVLSYAKGRNNEAAFYLSKVDIRSLSRSAGSHLALVKGMIWRQQNPEKAISHLSEARLLAPGTLVDEAALRRRIPMSNKEKDLEAFISYLSRYFRRYGKSIYARALHREISSFVLNNIAEITPRHRYYLEDVLKRLPKEKQAQIYLRIARGSLVKGALPTAIWSASHAAENTEQGSRDFYRAALYEGASLTLSNQFDAGLEKLMSVKKETLRRGDRELTDAAFAIANYLRDRPQEVEDVSSPPKIDSYTAKRFPRIAASMGAARSLMSDTDAFLKNEVLQ